METGDVIQLAGVILTLVGLFFIYQQYKTSNEQIKISNEQTRAMHKQIQSQEGIMQRQYAIEVAQKFCDLLDHELGFLSAYYERIGLPEILSSIKYSDLKHFDYDEFKGLFPNDLKKRYMEALNEVNIKEAAELFILYNGGVRNSQDVMFFSQMEWDLPDVDNKDDILKNGSEEDIKKINSFMNMKYDMFLAENRIREYYYRSVTALLNKLEYMAMEFRVGLADEEIVYQSLHQVYLSIVKSLYGSISSINKRQPDKYYSNVIWLYRKWVERYSKKTNQVLSSTRKLEHTSKYETA